MHAIDANRAWAVGEWGTRIYTGDGGSTWEDHSVLVTLDHPMFVWLSVSDQERVREGKKVYEDVGLNDVFCLSPAEQECWIIGEFGYILRIRRTTVRRGSAARSWATCSWIRSACPTT